MNGAAGLTLGGSAFMFLAWGSITLLSIWCYARILGSGRKR